MSVITTRTDKDCAGKRPAYMSITPALNQYVGSNRPTTVNESGSHVKAMKAPPVMAAAIVTEICQMFAFSRFDADTAMSDPMARQLPKYVRKSSVSTGRWGRMSSR